jgi:hypothetical protein
MQSNKVVLCFKENPRFAQKIFIQKKEVGVHRGNDGKVGL